MLVLLLGGCQHTTSSDNEQVLNRGSDKDQWWSELPRGAWAAFPRIKQSQPWFEVYQVARGVVAIYEPGQFEEVISYLITGNSRALLFDTGLGIGDMHSLVAELTDLPVTVINSHSHYDHIGGNHAFSTILARDTAYTRQRATGLAHEEVAEFVGAGWIWKPLPVNFDAKRYQTKGFMIKAFVRDGQRIQLGGRTLEVLFTPGHAPDAICLLDRENRQLFTGDTFYPAPLYTHLPGSDFSAYRNSAKKLAALQSLVDVLLPAHNVPVVPATYLPQLHHAFDAISRGDHPFQQSDGNREYLFDGFSVITEP